MERSRRHGDAGSHHDADVEADPEIVMFFLGADGELLDDLGPGSGGAPRRTLADVGRAWRAALEREAQRETGGRNRLGPRPVQGTGRPAKPGYRDEIVVTARAGPERAVAAAVRSSIFSPPIGHLDVDTSSLTSRRYELAWDARIAVWPWQRRRVRLRLYASPSLNVTVLALSPLRSRRTARRRFLRVGNRVMNEVRARLDERVDGV